MGYGIYTWDNGWTYRGNFDNDFRNGFGELFDGQNRLNYSGNWYNGDQIANINPQHRNREEDYNPERAQSPSMMDN